MPSAKVNEDGTNEETVAFTSAEEKDVEAPELETKVKFANGAAEAVVDVEGDTHMQKTEEFVGLTKAELMKYADDPYWKRVRRILFILFVVVWVAMLVAAIIIIALAPRCPPRPDQQWWQTCNSYQVLPKSFKDSNGDGIGDIKGIHEKIGYLRDDLNVTAVYISSFYKGDDDGVTNHKEVHPDVGTIEDFEALVTAFHKKTTKVILDFIPNYTSMNHPWFEKSQKKEGNFTDYYVWHSGKPVNGSSAQPNLPSNWLSVHDGNHAWEWDVVRGEYYLHQFGVNQPELNLRNERVLQELTDILVFWMEKGADGFKVDASAYLVEAADVTMDEPINSDPNIPPESYLKLDHIHTTFQPETFKLLANWRQILDNKGKSDGRERLLMVDVMGGTANQTASMVQYKGRDGAQLLVNTKLTEVEDGCDAACVQVLVQGYLDLTDRNKLWPTWQTGNEGVSRLASRMKTDDYLSALTMMFLTLPGTPFTYYGEEIAMQDVPSAGMNSQRTPMQWDRSAFAGFTSGNSSWLPVSADFKSRNVKSEKAVGAGITNLDVYMAVSGIRKNPSFQWGVFKAAVYENVYFYTRKATGFPGYLVALNLGESPTTIDFIDHAPPDSDIPSVGEIVANTGNIADHRRSEEMMVGNEVDLSNLYIGAKEGLIFKY